MTLYLDTSALVKLLVTEPESAALRDFLREHDGRRVSSSLVRTELARAVLRARPELLPTVPQLLAGLSLLSLDASLLDAAGALQPAGLRSLEAVHLASALRVAPVTAVVTYDVRMQEAADGLGLPVAAPGG